MVTIKELYDMTLIGSPLKLFPVGDLDFMQEYSHISPQVDRMISFLYGSRNFDVEKNQPTPTGALVEWHTMCNAFLESNKTNFQFLYDGLKKEYDPISNYDKNSEITTSKEGTESNSVSESGKEIDTTIIGVGKVTNTAKISPNEDSEFLNNSQNISENDAQTNSNEKSFENRETNSTLSFNERKDKVIEHTYGNIGVTTSTQMLEGEYALRMRSFYLELFEKIIKTFTF